MPTSNERKALWFLAFVAASGTAVRLWRANAPPPPPAEAAALSRQIGRVDSARASRGKRPLARSKEPKETPAPVGPVDLDRASADEIEKLPGIGPALASRIIASRDSNGTFGELDALCQVKGVGPALAKRLGPLVTFSGARRPVGVTCGKSLKMRGMRAEPR